MRQVNTFSFCLDTCGHVRLPMYAIYDKQVKTDKFPMRYLYVLDVRTIANETFTVHVYVPSTNGKYTMSVNVKTSAIARHFANYAQKCIIHAPIWPIYHRDNIGQPTMRKQRPFDTKYGYIRGEHKCTERSVIDGCVIGTFRHTEESYHTIRLGMDAIQFTSKNNSALSIDDIELPSLV